MAYLCVSNDCALQSANELVKPNDPLKTDINDSNSSEQVLNIKISHTDEEFVIPEYVCCVLTEGVWTVFGACLLIVVLMTIATLKYIKKRLAKTKYNKKNLRMKDR